jgi:hypothetical protein
MRHIPEDKTLQSHYRENRKSYNLNLVCSLVKVSEASFNCLFNGFSSSHHVTSGEVPEIKSAFILSL